MNFILNPKFSDGNTPIRCEEAEQLIPKISTMAELNEYEALNIVQAREWAFSSRTMKSSNPLDEAYLRELHAKMFDKVWKWAGTYRKNELNIGCDPREIVQRIPQLLYNTQHWIDQKVRPIDECILRFHYELVSTIHPFANGNGRHARMIADVVAVKHGRPEFSWGAGQNLIAQGTARATYLAALRALDADANDVQPLLAFARS
jgi:Fic-DOC domain mobile mystery protein B